MQANTITAPAHWASALVNGDYSGLDDSEVRQLWAWKSRERVTIVSTVEDSERFTWHYRLYNPFAPRGITGGNVLDYVTLS